MVHDASSTPGPPGGLSGVVVIGRHEELPGHGSDWPWIFADVRPLI
jgi:hypothetical protein